MISREEVVLPCPELRGAALELGRTTDLETALDGPAGTGKTYGALFKIHMMLLSYPGAKALVARKSNTALAGSAIATYREMLDDREPVHYFGGNKIRPSAFEYKNGSLMLINGLDKPEKIRSWEFDIAFINEATECDEEDIEFVRMRLRHGKTPYHQLILDLNPDSPNHWLNLRCNSGKTKRLVSRHEDNPRYWDTKTNDWTREGREYVLGTLGGLTGVRLARYRYGLWASASGTVYEQDYDRAKNVIKRHPIPIGWPRYICLDFGYNHPFVALWFAEDPDGRFICYREIYMTHRLVEQHAKQIKALSRWGEKDGDPIPRAIYADHDAEGREVFTKYAGLQTTPARKSVLEGIQAMASRLRPSGDGKPRLLFFDDTLVEVDQHLVNEKKPKRTLEEFDSYVWKQTSGVNAKEEPVKAYDHGLDCCRYLCAKDILPDKVSYVKNFWK